MTSYRPATTRSDTEHRVRINDLAAVNRLIKVTSLREARALYEHIRAQHPDITGFTCFDRGNDCYMSFYGKLSSLPADLDDQVSIVSSIQSSNNDPF